MTIGQRICELRKKSGFSQEYVAERLGVSRQAVSKWETDATAPDTYNLIALAELFGVTVEYVATGKREERVDADVSKVTKRGGMTVQKIVGIVLLGVGLVALILGILLSWALLIIALYLIVGGILCLAARKRVWFIAMWTFGVLTFLVISILTTQNLFCIFNPSFYQGGVSMGMIVSYAFWIWMIAAVAITVTIVVKRYKIK